MQLSWIREDIVSSDDDFAEMASLVARYVVTGAPSYRTSAIAKTAAIRSKESGEIADKLDKLYSALGKSDVTKLNEALDHVIEEKRKAKGKNETDG